MTHLKTKSDVSKSEMQLLLLKFLTKWAGDIPDKNHEISERVWEILLNELWSESVPKLWPDLEKLFNIFRTKTVYLFSQSELIEIMGWDINEQNLRKKINNLRNKLPDTISIITVPKFWYYMHVVWEDISSFTSILEVEKDFYLYPKLHSIHYKGEILALRKSHFDFLYTLILQKFNTVTYTEFIWSVDWINVSNTRDLSDIKNKVKKSLDSLVVWLWDKIISVDLKWYKWK